MSTKKKRIEIPYDISKSAIQEISEGAKLRETARKYSIPKTTLSRYVVKGIPEAYKEKYKSKHVSTQVFTANQETELCTYILKCSKMHYGLQTKQVLTLAYEFGSLNKIKMPSSWVTNRSASKDWLRAFMRRNSTLSLRKPEATSLSRASSFNRTNVGNFFNNLQSILSRHTCDPSSIWNLDETGVTTVQVSGKVLASKGCKQVGKVTSAERGSLVTLCCAINATGNFLPPFFIFPRVHFKNNMIHNSPPGSAGTANPSGWMTAQIFIDYFKFFVEHTKPTPEKPLILICDNHESHMNIEVINMARKNGIILLTLPPHCSHRLQPLDVSVYGPFKGYYNSAADKWMLNHPGMTISIYEIAELVGEAFPRAFTPMNIQKGFLKTGIYPTNKDIFTDDDFMCSAVTDRSYPLEGITAKNQNEEQKEKHNKENVAEYSNIILPEVIRPFPKANPRKRKGGRRPGGTKILTDTPVKQEIEAAAQKKLQKIKRKIVPESSSGEEEESSPNFLCQDSDDSPIEDIEKDNNCSWNEYDRNFMTDDNVIVKFATKSTVLHLSLIHI